jgi:hypothetical protein
MSLNDFFRVFTCFIYLIQCVWLHFILCSLGLDTFLFKTELKVALNSGLVRMCILLSVRRKLLINVKPFVQNSMDLVRVEVASFMNIVFCIEVSIVYLFFVSCFSKLNYYSLDPFIIYLTPLNCSRVRNEKCKFWCAFSTVDSFFLPQSNV